MKKSNIDCPHYTNLFIFRHTSKTPQPFSHDCSFNCSELELKEVLAYFILFSSPKHQSFALRRAQWCRLLMPLPSMYTNTMGSNMFWRVRYYPSYTFFHTINFFVHKKKTTLLFSTSSLLGAAFLNSYTRALLPQETDVAIFLVHITSTVHSCCYTKQEIYRCLIRMARGLNWNWNIHICKMWNNNHPSKIVWAHCDQAGHRHLLSASIAAPTMVSG